jgi:predicted XRE-type DNA-binding protein
MMLENQDEILKLKMKIIEEKQDEILKGTKIMQDQILELLELIRPREPTTRTSQEVTGSGF